MFSSDPYSRANITTALIAWSLLYLSFEGNTSVESSFNDRNRTFTLSMLLQILGHWILIKYKVQSGLCFVIDLYYMKLQTSVCNFINASTSISHFLQTLKMDVFLFNVLASVSSIFWLAGPVAQAWDCEYKTGKSCSYNAIHTE